jgi:hypothetical protein
MCASGWSFSHICITMHGSENVKDQTLRSKSQSPRLPSFIHRNHLSRRLSLGDGQQKGGKGRHENRT